MKRISKKVICSSFATKAEAHEVSFPKNAAILSIIEHDDNIVVLFLADSEETQSFTFKFFIFETEEDLPSFADDLSYLRSMTLSNGKLVHVFVDLRALEEQPAKDAEEAIQ